MLDNNSYARDRQSCETVEKYDQQVEEGDTPALVQRMIRGTERNEDSHDGETVMKGEETILSPKDDNFLEEFVDAGLKGKDKIVCSL